MKTNFSKFGSFVLVLSMVVCAYSCTKEEPETTPEQVKFSKYIPDPIVLPTNHLEWDESYHPYDKTTRANNESDQMAVTYLYQKNGQTIIKDGVKSRISDHERLYEYSLVESDNYVILGNPLNQDNCPLSRKD